MPKSLENKMIKNIQAILNLPWLIKLDSSKNRFGLNMGTKWG